jgi:hypothetical protein
LVAVVSGGSQGCESPTNFMRTDAHANWIAAILAGTDAGTCATCVEPDPSCAAATETEPAGSAEEDAGSSDDAGAGAKKAAGGGGSGGGCDLARPTSGDGELAPFVGLLGILGLLLRARRRPRSQV